MDKQQLRPQIYRLYEVKIDKVKQEHKEEEEERLRKLQRQGKLASSACPISMNKLYQKQMREKVDVFIDSIVEVIKTGQAISIENSAKVMSILKEFIQNHFNDEKERYIKLLTKINAVQRFLPFFESTREALEQVSEDKLDFKIRQINIEVINKKKENRWSFYKDIILKLLGGLLGFKILIMIAKWIDQVF